MNQMQTLAILPLTKALSQSLPADLNGPVTDADWLDLWSTHFTGSTALALADGSTFLPLSREKHRGLVPFAVLRGLTNGQSQYTAISLDPTAPLEAAQRVLTALKRRRDWDFMRLQGIAEPLASTLTEAANALGLPATTEYSFANHVTDLAAIRAGEAAFPLSGETRRRKERQQRALEREGPVQIMRITGPDRPAAMQRYLLAERKSWKSTGGELLGDGGALERFYQGLANLPGTEIWFMQMDERIIAGLILRRSAGILVGLKCFYDQSFEKASPATLLCLHMLRHALEDASLHRIDWYSNKDSYRIFSTGTCNRQDLIIWRDGLRPKFLRHSRSLLQQFRALRHGQKGTPL